LDSADEGNKQISKGSFFGSFLEVNCAARESPLRDDCPRNEQKSSALQPKAETSFFETSPSQGL